jgi:hypothetical protein
LVGVALTAIGLLFTFGLQNPGDERLLLAAPPLALMVSFPHLSESFRIHRLGDYIREDLPEYLKKQTGYPHSWKTWHFEPAPLSVSVEQHRRAMMHLVRPPAV